MKAAEEEEVAVNTISETAAAFACANGPAAGALACGGTASLLWAALCLMAAGYLKTRQGWKTGYTRKLFHFLIFGTVVAVNRACGLAGVCVFGAATSLVLAYALARGEGHFMYEALAREKDAPHRTRFIVEPYLATLAGGLAANLLFPQTVAFGYLVAGLGDAVAEPVGTRFGRHRYRVPTLGGVAAERSLEGSTAVLVVSALALLACLGLSPHFTLTTQTAGAAVLLALVSAAAEAASPHGWDNAVLQVLPAGLGALLLST